MYKQWTVTVFFGLQVFQEHTSQIQDFYSTCIQFQDFSGPEKSILKFEDLWEPCKPPRLFRVRYTSSSLFYCYFSLYFWFSQNYTERVYCIYALLAGVCVVVGWIARLHAESSVVCWAFYVELLVCWLLTVWQPSQTGLRSQAVVRSQAGLRSQAVVRSELSTASPISLQHSPHHLQLCHNMPTSTRTYYASDLDVKQRFVAITERCTKCELCVPVPASKTVLERHSAVFHHVPRSRHVD